MNNQATTTPPQAVTAVNSVGTEKIPTASGANVVGECRPDGTAASGFAPTPVKQPPTANGSETKPVTFANTKRHAEAVAADNRPLCAVCRCALEVKRSTGPKAKKYCSSYCRGVAFRSRRVI